VNGEWEKKRTGRFLSSQPFGFAFDDSKESINAKGEVVAELLF